MNLEKIIYRDINSLATDLLISLDYKVDKKNSSFLQLMNLNHLLIADIPRKISFSKKFKLPPKYEEGFQLLSKKCESGTGGLFQHQSRKLFKGNAIDLMFCDFGIHHLHLGVEEDLKHKRMMQGTEEVVFAYLNEEEIFFIKIANHGEWHLKNNLEILHRERPDLIQHRVVSGLIGENLKDEEILALRKNGYTYFLDIDGTCYMPEEIWGGKNIMKGHAYFIQLKYKIEKIIEEQIQSIPSIQKLIDNEDVDIKLSGLDFNKFKYFYFDLIISGNLKQYKVFL